MSAGDLAARLSARSRARARRWWIAAAVAALLAALAAVAWFSPLLEVEEVRASGGGITDTASVAAQVEAAALQVPLPQVRTGALERELEESHTTADRITVSYAGPRTLAVRITDRVPVIAVVEGDSAVRYDSHGARIDTVAAAQAGDLPLLTLDAEADPGRSSVAAAELVSAVSAELPGEISDLAAHGPGPTLTVSLQLDDDTAEVVFGDAGEAERKSRIAALLLADGAGYVDVSVPDVPFTR